MIQSSNAHESNVAVSSSRTRKTEDELTFISRKVENEVREEVDREASVLKSRAKLAEQKRDGANLTSF